MSDESPEQEISAGDEVAAEEAAQAEWQAQRDDEMARLRREDSARLTHNEAVNYARSHAKIDPETGKPVYELPDRPEE